jgi:hypothetical protein
MPLELAWKATLLVSFAGLAALALSRASAALRHLVWLSALCTLVLLPLAIVIAPSWRPSIETTALLPQMARTVMVVSASAPAPPIPMSTIIFAVWAMIALLLVARLSVG